MEADSSEEAIKIQKQTAQTGTTVCVSEQSVFLCQSTYENYFIKIRVG